MSEIYKKAFFEDKIISIEDAHLSIASSAVLYGLSVYTVFPIVSTQKGFAAFRIKDHYERLVKSAKIIGIDTFEVSWNFDRFVDVVKETYVPANPAVILSCLQQCKEFLAK